MVDRPRVRTGIEGLDNALNGGIPLGNVVLLTGSCGTGKTTLSMEFLANGAIRDEVGVFISVTEPSYKLLDNLKTYDFFDGSLITKRKLFIFDLNAIYEKLGLENTDYSLDDVDALIRAISDIVTKLQAKRVVIDSITAICSHLQTEGRIRDFIFKLGETLTAMGVTTLLISEIEPDSAKYSMYGVEEAIADGIIVLGNLERRGDLLRTLQIVKMRGTPHSRAKYVMDLTPHGVILVPLLKWGTSFKLA